MEARPRIGICLGLDEGELRRGRETAYLDSAYPEAVSAAGGIPILLPLPAEPGAALTGVDGLLVPGGDDFPPTEPYPDAVSFAPAPARQRAFDAEILGRALERGLPVLAICYGMQLLALHRGGALLYDLPTDRPDGLAHKIPGADGRHSILVEPDTRLAALLGPGEHEVNSRHHQAIETPGEGMVVSARSPDGLIEAIEAAGPEFTLGVQWHPEDLEGPEGARLFGAFVEASRTR